MVSIRFFSTLCQGPLQVNTLFPFPWRLKWQITKQCARQLSKISSGKASGEAREARELTLSLVRSSPRALALTGHCNGSLHLGHHQRSLGAANTKYQYVNIIDSQMMESSAVMRREMWRVPWHYTTRLQDSTSRIKYGLGTCEKES